MIILDTETTGLLQPDAAPLSAQPRIIEFAAVKVNRELKVTAQLEFKLNPERPLEPIITKITGLRDEDLKDAPRFAEKLNELEDFFLGERAWCAHNLAFDSGMMRYELTRMGRQFAFPWPPRPVCTVEATHHLENRRFKLIELYKKATGTALDQKHRAMDDVLALVEVVRWCVVEGHIREELLA